MNLFNLLKSKAGKLVLGTSQVVVLTVGAAGLFASGAFKTGEALGEKELAVRSLSSVSSRYSYEGLERRDGMLTSMNIQNREGSQGVAVGAVRARLEGNGSANDFGLTAVDNLDRTITVPGTGAAAASSATDGLGSGGVDMVEVGGGHTYTRTSGPSVGVGAVSQEVNGAAATGTSGVGGRLASASMARASGNAFNAASGAMGGTSASSVAGRGGVAAHSSSSDGYQFSGAMPSGSNVVSQSAALANSASRSSFVAGGRNSTVGKGRHASLRDKDNDLILISKRSAAAAGDSYRSANAGARAFLDSSQNSGGISIDGGEEAVATGSADFSTPTNRSLKKIGDWGDRESEKDKERAKDRNNLAKLLMWSFFATIVAIPLGYLLISAGRSAGGPWGVIKIIAGCLVLAAAIGVAIALCVAAGKYAHKWEGGLLSTLSGIIGGISIAVLGLTVAAAFSNAGSPLSKFFDKIMPGAKTLAIGKVVSKGTELVSNEVSKSAQSKQPNSSKK